MLNRDNDDDDVDLGVRDDINKHLRVHSTQSVSTTYDIYLLDEVKRPYVYGELFKLLASVSERDQINFHLNNFGGLVHTGHQLIGAIKGCKANITMVVAAPVYSMAAILAVVGNDLIVKSPAFLMFHDYASVEAGKGHEMQAGIEAYKKYFSDLLTDYCHPFLSKDEIKTILAGGDTYIHTKDAIQRFKRHINVPKKVSKTKTKRTNSV